MNQKNNIIKLLNNSKMKVNELRIGNLVYFEDEILKFDFESGFNFDFIKPIPLTEEICYKLGCYYGFGGEPRFELNNQITMSILFINGNTLCLIGDDLQVQIYFVHQLQNLYFALTNEELTYEQQK